MTVNVNRKDLVYTGKVFNLYTENVTLPNGNTTDLNILRHPGAAAMVALTEEQQIVLIKQYRHAINDYIWEIPAGTLDPDETPLVCARRELVEEAGVSANKWEKLGEIVPVPGYSDERIHIFLAAELEEDRQNLDVDEILDVHQIDFSKALSMIRKGQIVDAKSITGIFLARDYLQTISK